MNIDDINWHDSLILSVSIDPEKATLEMRLLYPVEWKEDDFAERTVLFEDAYGYKEHEGPFLGSPTILTAEVVEEREGWNLLRLQTNAGYRELYCKRALLRVS